ncbi:hypothetical protein SHIRM173S_08194 [Streptomyces hirsutus]
MTEGACAARVVVAGGAVVHEGRAHLVGVHEALLPQALVRTPPAARDDAGARADVRLRLRLPAAVRLLPGRLGAAQNVVLLLRLRPGQRRDLGGAQGDERGVGSGGGGRLGAHHTGTRGVHRGARRAFGGVLAGFLAGAFVGFLVGALGGAVLGRGVPGRSVLPGSTSSRRIPDGSSGVGSSAPFPAPSSAVEPADSEPAFGSGSESGPLSARTRISTPSDAPTHSGAVAPRTGPRCVPRSRGRLRGRRCGSRRPASRTRRRCPPRGRGPGPGRGVRWRGRPRRRRRGRRAVRTAGRGRT